MSFPLVAPLVIYPCLLWGAVRGWQHWWGYPFDAVYLGLVGLFLWEALSRKEFEKAGADDPSLNRATWVLNWLIFFVVLPLGAWMVAAVMVLGR
jgi:hypothetical protein